MKELVDVIKWKVSEPRVDEYLHFSSDLTNDRHTAIGRFHPKPHTIKHWANTFPLLQGTAVHEAFHEIMEDVEDWNYISEQPIYYTGTDMAFEWMGTADAYLETPDTEYWLLDYKTTSGASLSFLDGPKPEHLFQVSAYYHFGVTVPNLRLGVLYIPTSPDYRRRWSDPVFYEVDPLPKEQIIKRMLDVEQAIIDYDTLGKVPDVLMGEYKWKNNKKERKWDLTYYPHYSSQYCPWAGEENDPCGCSKLKSEYIGCWYYYNGIDDHDPDTVLEHLDKCPGYIDLTNEEKYAIMVETKGESK